MFSISKKKNCSITYLNMYVMYTQTRTHIQTHTYRKSYKVMYIDISCWQMQGYCIIDVCFHGPETPNVKPICVTSWDGLQAFLLYHHYYMSNFFLTCMHLTEFFQYIASLLNHIFFFVSFMKFSLLRLSFLISYYFFTYFSFSIGSF